MKKIYVISVFLASALLIVLAILPSSYAGFYKEDKLNSIVKESTIQNIIILRFAPDGDVKTTAMDIEIDDISKISEIIEKKCNELNENDKEMQQLIDEKENFYKKIESQGYGLHFALFRPMVKFKQILRASIFYRYFNDEDYTNINNQTILSGPQKVRILGFIGYVAFSVRFFGYVAINGYSIFRIDIKPTS